MDFLEEGKEIPFGKEYREFEKRLAEYVGVKHAFFVNSGPLQISLLWQFLLPTEIRR